MWDGLILYLWQAPREKEAETGTNYMNGISCLSEICQYINFLGYFIFIIFFSLGYFEELSRL